MVAGTQLAWPDCPFPRNPHEGSITLCDADFQDYRKPLAPAVAARDSQGAGWLRHESTHTQLAMMLARVLRPHAKAPSSHQTLTTAVDFVGISSILADALLAEQPIETIDARSLLGNHHDAIVREDDKTKAAAGVRDRKRGAEWGRSRSSTTSYLRILQLGHLSRAPSACSPLSSPFHHH